MGLLAQQHCTLKVLRSIRTIESCHEAQESILRADNGQVPVFRGICHEKPGCHSICYDNLEAHVQGEHTLAGPSASFALLCAARCSLFAFALEAFCVISLVTFSSGWLFDDEAPMCPSPWGASVPISVVSRVGTNASSLEAWAGRPQQETPEGATAKVPATCEYTKTFKC
jgi:hypothetical protein